MVQQDEVLRRLRESRGDAVFSGETIGELDLQGQQLDVCLNLTGAHLTGSVDISNAKLRGGLKARRAIFGAPVRARHCELMGDLLLTHVHFASTIDMSWTQVIGKVWAWRARFRGAAEFFQFVCTPSPEPNRGFVYPGEANFSWSWFYAPASFECARFDGPVYFWRTRFFDNCNFNGCSFARDGTFMGKVSEICIWRDEIGRDFFNRLDSAGLLRLGHEEYEQIGGRDLPTTAQLRNVESLQELETRMKKTGLSEEDQNVLKAYYCQHAGHMFGKEVSLQRMRFEQLKKIGFVGVNASRWSLDGTDLDAISFFNANEQPVTKDVGLGYVYDTVFISYGGPDEPVARRFYDALLHAGVSAYFYKENALPGRLIEDEMQIRVRSCDRVLLICSRSSAERPGWRYELNCALKREEEQGAGGVLVPVAIDDGLWTEWSGEVEPLRPRITLRNVSDFIGALDNADLFNQRLRLLLESLRRRQPQDSAINNEAQRAI